MGEQLRLAMMMHARAFPPSRRLFLGGVLCVRCGRRLRLRRHRGSRQRLEPTAPPAALWLPVRRGPETETVRHGHGSASVHQCVQTPRDTLVHREEELNAPVRLSVKVRAVEVVPREAANTSPSASRVSRALTLRMGGTAHTQQQASRLRGCEEGGKRTCSARRRAARWPRTGPTVPTVSAPHAVHPCAQLISAGMVAAPCSGRCMGITKPRCTGPPPGMLSILLSL